MKRKNGSNRFFDYCKKNGIRPMLGVEGETPYYYMMLPAENAPNKKVEATNKFCENEILSTMYYSGMGARIARESENKDELLRLLNFVNTIGYNALRDLYGQNTPRLMYMPRIALSDEGDIYIETLIPYEFYETAPTETEYYLTVFCPEFLNILAPDIFLVLFGEIDADHAIKMILSELFRRKNGEISG